MATIDTDAKTGTEYGPVGYIYHLSSKKPIGPSGGKLDPTNGTELVVYSKKEAQVLQFRFVRVKEFGHFGYLEHVGSSKIIHPTEDNKLILRDSKEKNVNALFTFDLERYTIMHRNGKHWHTEGDCPTPKDDTKCLLQANELESNATIKDAAKFYFGNFDAHHLYPYSESSPVVSQKWKLLQAFIAPRTSHSFVINYKIGWVKEFSETKTHSWKISADIGYSFLKSIIGYNGSISLAETSTLTEEKNISLTINVEKGDTVCVWQYVHCLAELGEEIVFLQSNIICDTDSLDKKPDVKYIA